MIRRAQPFGRRLARRTDSVRVEKVTHNGAQINYELRIVQLESDLALLESFVQAIGEAAKETLELGDAFDDEDEERTP